MVLPEDEYTYEYDLVNLVMYGVNIYILCT